MWRDIQAVSTTGSTNADLAAAARAGAQGPLALVADYQESGRGRFTRVWQASPGDAVAISVLLRPQVELRRWTWLPLLGGLAVVDAARSLGVAAELKWPNDVLVGGAKLCGILAERVADDHGGAVVLGMGVNTAMPPQALPVADATSLAIEGGVSTSTEVVAAVLSAVESWYRRWESGEDLQDAYAAACASIGRRVRVVVFEDEQVEGTAVGVDSWGGLLVASGSGTRSFTAGDVWHLR